MVMFDLLMRPHKEGLLTTATRNEEVASESSRDLSRFPQGSGPVHSAWYKRDLREYLMNQRGPGPGADDQAFSDEWKGQEALLCDTVEVVPRQSTFVKSPSDVQHKA